MLLHMAKNVPPKTAASLAGKGQEMFLFFSNRLGCLGSLLLSLAVTGVLLLLLSLL